MPVFNTVKKFNQANKHSTIKGMIISVCDSSRHKCLTMALSMSGWLWLISPLSFWIWILYISLTHSVDICRTCRDGFPDTSVLHAGLQFSRGMSCVLTQQIHIGPDRAPHTSFAICWFPKHYIRHYLPELLRQWPANESPLSAFVTHVFGGISVCIMLTILHQIRKRLFEG